MKVEIQIDENCGEPRLIVVTRQVTDEIQTLIQSLSNTPAAFLAGFQEDELVLLQPREIIRIYAQEKENDCGNRERPVYRPAESAGSPDPAKSGEFRSDFPFGNHQFEQGEPF